MDGQGRPPRHRRRRQQQARELSGFGVNAALVAEIRQRYDVDPSSLHEGWAGLFERVVPGLETDSKAELDAQPQPAPVPIVRQPELGASRDELAQLADRHARVLRLIHAYRARGHRVATTDPLGGAPCYFPELDPAH